MTDWALAACAGKSPAHWDAEDEFAFHHCQSCPILARCLQQALLTDSEDQKNSAGMRGAWTLAQRMYFKRTGKMPKPINWERLDKNQTQRNLGGRLTKDADERRMALYRDGLHDRQMADELGTSPTAIESWRRHRKLPINSAQSRAPLTADDANNRQQAWELGFTDKQAAGLLKCSPHAYRMWRRRNGLKPNPGRVAS